ncbi:hypothetical protein BH11PSE11_BH11PSE11_07620 [soil metagenome]
MSNEEFDSLVAKLEIQARRDPARYQLRVLLLAILGNAYLATILLLIVGLLIASIALTMRQVMALKLVFLVGAFLLMILRALWVKIPPPEGTEVGAKKSPQLFALIEDLRGQLDAPPFHHVLITNDFNAGVVQAPQLGIFGWHKNYLLLGLPLMKVLSVEQFRAVLAHEFGHLAKGHGRASNWIYRQRLRWSRLMHVLDATDSGGSFLFKPFLNWFAPYFNAYSFPLARANEYEADATSARLTSSKSAAEALTTVSVAGTYLGERYWPQIHKQADDLPRPGFAPFSNMAQGFATELDEASTKLWLEQALAQETTSDDTHPALAERLKAIGETARLALPETGHAADELLGASRQVITDIFDRRWEEGILPSWQDHYQNVQEKRRKLADLNTRYEVGSALSVEEACERAWLTESAGKDADAALAQLRQLHEQEPNNAIVCVSLGSRLLERNDPAGLALTEKAMELDENLSFACCEVLRDYCRRCQREEDAQAWHQRMIERAQLEGAADHERSRVLISEKFDLADLPPESMAALRQQLQGIQGLRKAYLVKKRVQHLPQLPCYVFAYTVAGMFSLHNKKRAADVLEQIQAKVVFPGATLMINAEGDNSNFGRKFFWMKGARIL